MKPSNSKYLSIGKVMKRNLLKLSIIASTMIPMFCFSGELDTLHARISQEYATIEISDSNNLEALKSAVSGYLAKQNPDGSWGDINYQNIPTSGTPFREHLGRLKDLAAVHYLNENPKAINGLQRGVDYWFSISNRENANWWWNEIGKQLYFGPISMMASKQLSSASLSKITDIMPTTTVRKNGEQTTGANKTDLAKGVIWGAILSNNEKQLALGLSEVESTIKKTTGEGVQYDYSFHQHGPQLYTAGYGEVFYSTVAFWAYQVRDLQWSFDAKKVDLLANYMLEGIRWQNYRGIYGYNSKGRGISRRVNSDPQKSSLAQEADYITALRPIHTTALDLFKANITDKAPKGINGFKSFYKSDYVTKVGANHFVGIKMNSARMEPTEAGNGENLKGQWLGFGSMFTLVKGDEYRNIFPVWNWAHVPGVTSPEVVLKPADWGAIEQTTTFVGSVSNGHYGAAVMDMDFQQTQVKKSWFIFDDEIVALGAGITSTHSQDVVTTVEQSRLQGEVYVDGVLMNKGANNTSINDPLWVYHNNIGYVFLNRGESNKYLTNSQKTGNWKSINQGYTTKPVNEDVFELNINHGNTPSNSDYAYIVLPDTEYTDADLYSTNTGIQIISNTKDLQGVHDANLKISSLIFHKGGYAILPDGTKVMVNKPSALIVDQSTAEAKVTISTPGVGMPVKVELEKSGARKSTVVYTSSEHKNLGKSHVIDFDAPVIPQEVILNLTDDSYVRNGKYSAINYGGKTSMVVKSDGDSYSRKAVVKFDLYPAEPILAKTAKLKFYVKSVNSDLTRTINISRLKDQSWTEKNITWTLFPAIEKEGAVVNITPSHSNSWIEVDVSNLVLDQTGKVSFVIENRAKASSGSDFTIGTKESGKGATLILTP